MQIRSAHVLYLASFLACAGASGACSSDSDNQGGAGAGAGVFGAAGSGFAGTGAATAGTGAAAAGTGAITAGTGAITAGTGAVTAGTGAATAGTGAATAGSGASGTGAIPTEHFSFFVASVDALRALSGSQSGFGGNLSYDGATGILGADKICTAIAEREQAGMGLKGWRAFLSASSGGEGGGAIHAIERIGQGPWYDRNGVLIAQDISALLNDRPQGEDLDTADNLPNETGLPNQPSQAVDNHDVLTGSDAQGRYDGGNTCADWTSTANADGGGGSGGGFWGGGGGFGGKGPTAGHSWPAFSGTNWISSHRVSGCLPSVHPSVDGGDPGTMTSNGGVGDGGGYGAIYCFALMP